MRLYRANWGLHHCFAAFYMYIILYQIGRPIRPIPIIHTTVLPTFKAGLGVHDVNQPYKWGSRIADYDSKAKTPIQLWPMLPQTEVLWGPACPNTGNLLRVLLVIAPLMINLVFCLQLLIDVIYVNQPYNEVHGYQPYIQPALYPTSLSDSNRLIMSTVLLGGGW